MIDGHCPRSPAGYAGSPERFKACHGSLAARSQNLPNQTIPAPPGTTLGARLVPLKISLGL